MNQNRPVLMTRGIVTLLAILPCAPVLAGEAGRNPAPTPPLVPDPEIIIQNPSGATPPGSPALPRAIAPPIGDIAISNIDASGERVRFTRNLTVPRVLLRQASVREVLMTLANYAGYNVIFTDAQGAANASAQTVSLEFTNESVETIFNAVLLISGLQANLQGNTIYVGALLPQRARNLISRTLRLNQVKAINAATFLASQGAEFQRLVTKTEDIVDPLTGRVIGRREIPATLEALAVQNPANSKAALLLAGLRVAADDRLNSITLIGENRLVQVATSLLTQLDARRRQVMVNVKVIDVALRNTDVLTGSFIFGFVNGYVGQQNGNLTLRVGDPSVNDEFSSFFASLDAQIIAGNAKILTDPSVIVQEGQQATVKLTEKVLESVNTQVDPLSGVRTTTPVLSDAGLTLAVNIDQIDDNGYVTLSVSPTIAAPGTSFLFDSGQGTVNRLIPLIRRELASGLIRLRDGQTLVLTGVIQEQDRIEERKVPVLGDIPILGALFRSRNNETTRSEVIIILTPKIMEDGANSTVGLDFQPSPEAVELLQRQGFPVQPRQ